MHCSAVLCIVVLCSAVLCIVVLCSAVQWSAECNEQRWYSLASPYRPECGWAQGQQALHTLYTIHYTLYSIHYTLYTIHYIHYTLYTIQYTLYTIYGDLPPLSTAASVAGGPRREAGGITAQTDCSVPPLVLGARSGSSAPQEKCAIRNVSSAECRAWCAVHGVLCMVC
jgi:hypothetical protein